MVFACGVVQPSTVLVTGGRCLCMQVRTCAQQVIDSINESYKTEKNDLENRFGAICGQMQTLAGQSTLGAHLNAHLHSNDAATDTQAKPVLPRPFHV